LAHSLSGLGVVAWQSRDLAGLCRPEGRVPMEWILCRPVQTWGHGWLEQR
jgi:hypothetical protein